MGRALKVGRVAASGVLAISVLAVGLASSRVSGSQVHRGISPPSVFLISPKAGDRLVPGQQVTIAWEVDTQGRNTNTEIFEQEIFLSMDGGKHIAARITPQLSGTATSVQWTVPDMPTKRATLILGIGCECGADSFETRYPQKHASFRITKPPAGSQNVTVTTAKETSLDAGREVSLSWISSVDNAARFEVRESFDRGAHFQTVGSTSSNSFAWQVPSNVTGQLTLMVVALRDDGSEVDSLMMDTERITRAVPTGDSE